MGQRLIQVGGVEDPRGGRRGCPMGQRLSNQVRDPRWGRRGRPTRRRLIQVGGCLSPYQGRRWRGTETHEWPKQQSHPLVSLSPTLIAPSPCCSFSFGRSRGERGVTGQHRR